MASEEVITTGDSGLIRADGKEMATFVPSITGVEGVIGSTRGTETGKGVAVVLSLSSGVRRELVASVSSLVSAFKVCNSLIKPLLCLYAVHNPAGSDNLNVLRMLQRTFIFWLIRQKMNRKKPC